MLGKPKDAVKDPYILEFPGLSERSIYSESQLEQELIDKLERFLPELGSVAIFVGHGKNLFKIFGNLIFGFRLAHANSGFVFKA